MQEGMVFMQQAVQVATQCGSGTSELHNGIELLDQQLLHAIFLQNSPA